MYKLVILIENIENWTAFDDLWPQFLHEAESMPGLRRETTSRMDELLYGEREVGLMHELYFDSRQQAQQAMASPPGQAAGKLLQALTAGKMTLLFADHKEDDLENIRKFKAQQENKASADGE